MKKSRTIYMLVLCVLACVLMSTKVYSQFLNATLAESAVGAATITSDNTGNDILTLGGNTYSVTIWNDNSGNTNDGLYWDYNGGTSTGFVNLSNTAVTDPDVCLIEDGTNIFAVATYHDGGNYYWEYFQWISSSSTFGAGTAASFQTASFGNTVNIDGNDISEFIITWDKPSTTTVYAVAGRMASGTPGLYLGGSPVTISSDGIYPDVALYYDGTSDQVDFVYRNALGKLDVDFHRFLAIATNNTGPTIAYTSASPIYQYTYPRIACPNNGSGTAADFTVVTEDYSVPVGIYYIYGFNVNNTTTTTTTYNNGAGSQPQNISTVPNFLPVVTYDNSASNIWVGWIWDNTANSITGTYIIDAKYPIALKCNSNAAAGGLSYLTVPRSTNISSGDIYSTFSIAGRYSTRNVYSYYKASSTNDVFHKIASQSIGQLRVENNSYSSDIFSIFEVEKQNIDLENSLFTFKLFDLSGKQIISVTGSAGKIASSYNAFAARLNKGIYLFTVISSDSKFFRANKIFLNQY